MQLRPREDEALLPVGKSAGEPLDGYNPVYTNLILIISVEVRRMISGANLDKHANDDSKEARDFRHSRFTREPDYLNESIQLQHVLHAVKPWFLFGEPLGGAQGAVGEGLAAVGAVDEF